MRGKTSKKTGKEGKKSVKVEAQKSKVSSPPASITKRFDPSGKWQQGGPCPTQEVAPKDPVSEERGPFTGNAGATRSVVDR